MLKAYTCPYTEMDVMHCGDGFIDEDGIFRDPSKDLAKPAPAAKPSAAKKAAATTARGSIRSLGYRALKSGTPKQKAWAETIRAAIVEKLPDDIASAFTDAPFHSAKFWINNRAKPVSMFADYARRDVELAKAAWEAHDAGEFASARKIVDERTKLSNAWLA